ncbi:class I SAM-dependent methyltransferase [Planomonospora algeriensis]
MTITAQIPQTLHRALFKTVSLLTARGQGAVLRRYFDWWHRRPDPWNLGTDDYEQHKYATTLRQLPARSYRRILEVGCSEGVFTWLLADTYPDAEITGIDISRRALERARRRTGEEARRVRFLQADILTHDPGHRFDLIFCAETLYYLGRDDRVRHACARLSALLEPAGLLVMVHPWPESQRLHRHLNADAAVSKLTEQADTTVHRPFSVAVYRAAPHRGINVSPLESRTQAGRQRS